MSEYAAAKTQISAKPLIAPIASGVLQRQCACGLHTSAGGECEGCKKKREGMLQRAAINPAPTHDVPPSVHEMWRLPRQPLHPETGAFQWPRFAHDFSQVPIRAATSDVCQPSLSVGNADDELEREADRAAEQVTRTESHETDFIMAPAASPSIQRQSESKTQTEEPWINGGFRANAAPPIVHEVLRSPGQPLDAATRAFMEPRFGHDFGGVRIHVDAQAAESARAVNALAYTVGRDIVFGSGQHMPTTGVGQRLLAHELTHVMQQSRGVQENRVQRLVNPARVSCSRYPRTYPIFRAIGTDDPVGALQAADARAVEVLSNTIDWLSSTRARIQAGEPPAWPVVNDCMAQSMRIRLLINPDDPNSWTRTGPNTVARIIRMLTNLRGVFQGGYIRYSCLDSGCDPDDDAFVQDGEGYLLHLCRGFWGMDADYRAIVLIHELAHIYYNTEDRGFLGLGSSYCIEGFLNDLNDINVPAVYQADCRGNQVNAC